ncbi:hypothetical protein [Mycoplasma capricolum]|uniref:Membrane protein n=1 Tax=Mycoplasma capricolum subsp. capricolum TaxID=40479 RepID=A0A0C2W637_MYCCA|nr:hypothetical protein [Mycoplasma capricolum]KIM13757.1 membrane protein [Mycoplasma capricolum subsp. capricolum]
MKKLLSILSTLAVISTSVIYVIQAINKSNFSINTTKSNFHLDSKLEDDTSDILDNLRPSEIELAKELEKDYLERVKVLQKKLDLIKKDLDAQKSLIEKLRQELQVKQEELNNLISGTNFSSTELDVQKQELIKQLKELIEEQNQYTNIYNQFNNQLSELALYNTNLKNDVRKQNLEINQQTSTKKQLEKEKNNLIKSKDERIQLYEKNIVELQKQIQELQKPNSKLKVLEIKIEKLTKKIGDLNSIQTNKEKEFKELENTFLQNKNKIEKLDSENLDLNNQLERTGISELLSDQQKLQNTLNQLKELKKTKDLTKNYFSEEKTIYDLVSYSSRYYNYFNFPVYGRKPKHIEYNSDNYDNFSLGSSVVFASYNLQKDLGVSNFREFKQKYNKIILEADYCFNGGEIYDKTGRTNNFIRTYQNPYHTSDEKPMFKVEDKVFKFNISSNTKENDQQQLDEIREWSDFYVHGKVYWKIQLSGNFINFIAEQRTAVYYQNSWLLQPMTILYLEPKKLKFELNKSYIDSKINNIKKPVTEIINKYKD